MTKIHTGTETKVQQHFKDEVSSSNIVKKFRTSGELPIGNTAPPQYLDHSEHPDFTEQLNKVTEVQQKFQALPAKTRARFQNRPEQLLKFLSDKKNTKEAQELGLIPPAVKPEPEKAGAPTKEPEKEKPAPKASKPAPDGNPDKG